MADRNSSSEAGRFTLTIDTWAVIVALVLALAVKMNLLNKIPW